MLGLGQPCAKKSKIEKQRLYNQKRKEKPRKPQFSLNFQLEFREEEMKEIQERFVRLRNKMVTKLRSSRVNADFLKVLLDRFEGKDPQTEPSKPRSQSVSAQANATETVFELFSQREEEKVDVQCQWPGRELDVPAC